MDVNDAKNGVASTAPEEGPRGGLAALGARAVACVPLTSWLPGVRLLEQRGRVEGEWRGMRDQAGKLVFVSSGRGRLRLPYLPDLTDPATVGCLRSLVRDAWSDQLLSTEFCPADKDWLVQRLNPGSDGWRVEAIAPTEAAALVAALEAAPDGGAS